MAKDRTAEMSEELTAPRAKGGPPLRNKDLLSSGSTLLNLALSGKASGAFYKGLYYHFVGDSDSGKTFLTLTTFAEAALNKRFKDYRFVHDNAEDGALMDMRRFFGSAADRIEPPQGTRDDPTFSHTMEDFYYNIDDAMAKGPCIYLLDSLDALSSTADGKKFQQHKKAARRAKGEDDKKEAGTFGTAKAKVNAGHMREVFNKIKKTGSILFIISQARHALNNPFETKTFSGGTALKFFCRAQVWFSTAGQITRPHGKKKHQAGIISQVRVKKNHQTGRRSTVQIPIYWSTGVDDTGGCVDYLIKQGHWRKKGGLVQAKELDVQLRVEDLIRHVEGNNLEPQLRAVVEDVWEEIRAACVPERKNRYGGE